MSASVKMKSAQERLDAARAAAKRLGAECEFIYRHRQQCLLSDDDEGAERADEQLVGLRLAAYRAEEKTRLLSDVVEAERERADRWPENLEDARSRLKQMEVDHAHLMRKRPIDRSARDQDVLDVLASAIPALANHIAHLERMEKP